MKAMLNEPWRLGPPANQPPSAIDIIEMLCNGLEWNIENYPDTMNVSDQEALQQARAFLAAAPTPVEPAAEIEKWRKFAAHCQRVVAAIKLKMSPEQAVEFMGEEIDRKIANLATQDGSDLDPDLLAYVEELFADRSGAVEPGNPATPSVHPSPTLRQEAEPADADHANRERLVTVRVITGERDAFEVWFGESFPDSAGDIRHDLADGYEIREVQKMWQGWQARAALAAPAAAEVDDQGRECDACPSEPPLSNEGLSALPFQRE